MSNAAQEEFNELFRDKDRRQNHPEDNTDSGRDSPEPTKENYYEKDDLDDSEDERGRSRDNMPGRYYLPALHSHANTGPKGVIADAQAFEKAKKQEMMRSRTNSPAVAPVNARHSMILPQKVEDTFNSDDDEGFLAKWRNNRLEHYKQRWRARSSSSNRSPSRRIYGSVIEVDSDGYLDALEKTPRETTVVVFIYDDASEVSGMVEKCLRKVARNNPSTRFVKFHVDEAEIDASGVPALLAYKGGEKFADMLPILNELPDGADLSSTSLESAMQKCGMV